MKFYFKQLMLANLVLIFFTIIAVFYLDRPIALFMHSSGLDQIKGFRIITEDSPILIMLFILAVILGKKQLKLKNKLVLAAYFYLGLYLTMELKTGLKIIFGRYWPKTWFNNNLSLIHNNVFGFDFWHGSGNMGSFPSGHTTYVAFCMVWLICLLPHKRYWFLGLFTIVSISFIVLDYHFLGDCIAGLIVGGNCAILSLYLEYKILRIINVLNLGIAKLEHLMK